ncbi:putative proline-rich receptor-like protein kinase PERK6 [Cynara cardunculus var. scolymus]|uniref:non-specific serine/threonine protein kinase n=1 Tax=Cynara cardunculus var. scolymus TaxID=59895 RepID=A0A118K6I6_CYNCS|nr:putative proline-rich receptor-like protein kinase PERK6 [Cynara cardunculus var. scolymus]KVI10723.1 hypothetical protein Ccrd_010873 [Cynara cardunculus var. scolymus]
MPSSHSQDSSKSLPSFKDSGSSSANKNNNKNGSLSSSANKHKSSSSDKSNNDNKKPQNKNKSNKKKHNDDKSSSPALPRSLSSSHFALYPPLNSSSSEKYGSSSYNINNVIITGAAIGAVLLLLLMIACTVCCCHRKKKRQRYDNNRNNPSEIKVDTNNGYYSTQHAGNQLHEHGDLHLKMPPQPHSNPRSSDQQGWVAAPPPPPLGMVGSNEKNVFTYDDLVAATKEFDSSLLLGQGGFGYVHKGVLPNGKEVAVKSLKLGSGQGEHEFQTEVETISRIHHRHLVSLVGYCIAGQQRMLVYEFIPNKTLEYHLHGEGCPFMDCSTRFKLALGAAKGFAYLHEDCNPRIVHRNIKAANILLDEHYEAKVVDFGLTKLSSEIITHVSTRVMGTFGYLAPEYASMGKLTEKSDVYSYGVVLLELITGRRPINRNSDEGSLIDWARPILMHASDGGSLEKMVDPRIKENYNREKMLRMVACAAACIRHSPRIRPKMSQIVRILEGKVSFGDLKR